MFLVSILLIPSCENHHDLPQESAASESEDGEQLSAEAQAYLRELRASGGLRVAAVDSASGVQLNDGGYSGLHYSFLTGLSREFGIRIEISYSDFTDLFTVDGELPADLSDPEGPVYSADIFTRADMIAHSLTVLPWRQRLFRFVQVFPTRILLINNAAVKVDDISDLRRIRVVVIENTSYQDIMELLRQHFGFTYFTVPYGTEIFQLVSEGEYDATLRDADFALSRLVEHRNLRASIPMSEIQYIGWAVSPDNPELAEILQAYFSRIRENGTFESIWLNHFNISYSDFLELIDFRP
jgi:membrane-bound lytic murein transglycosylase MltF